MVEVKCGERASGPPGLPRAARPCARALLLTASAVPYAPAGPGPAHLASSALGAG